MRGSRVCLFRGYAATTVLREWPFACLREYVWMCGTSKSQCTQELVKKVQTLWLLRPRTTQPKLPRCFAPQLRLWKVGTKRPNASAKATLPSFFMYFARVVLWKGCTPRTNRGNCCGFLLWSLVWLPACLGQWNRPYPATDHGYAQFWRKSN